MPYDPAMNPLQVSIDVFTRGGPVMWPLLAMSLLSITLSVERAWFWIRVHRKGITRWLDDASTALRTKDQPNITRLTKSNRLIYSGVLTSLASRPVTDATGVELAESARPLIDRFAAIQSVIITAAPLLGILGTVLGIIESFEVLSANDAVRDINAVSAGIAEALITTAAGLIVALITLFPHALYRAHANRCLGNIERLAAAALQGAATPAAKP